MFIKKFVERNKDHPELFKNNSLYVFGSGNDYKEEEVNVIYLRIDEVKSKLKRDGEFKLVKLSDLIIKEDKIKTSFLFFKAIENDEADFYCF